MGIKTPLATSTLAPGLLGPDTAGALFRKSLLDIAGPGQKEAILALIAINKRSKLMTEKEIDRVLFKLFYGSPRVEPPLKKATNLDAINKLKKND